MRRPRPTTEEHAVGDVIAGRYRLDEHIESGGFGAVYRATQIEVGRDVALKLLHRDVLDSAVAVERFLREGRLAQQLEHPNTVRLYDLGQTDSGVPFIAYQLLHGSSLEKLLDGQGPLPPGRVARVAAQVLKSLMEAHESGIVHRDIKPPNIYLVDFQGEPDFVKVLDFGIGKPLLADPNELDLTRDGEVIGTPSYMSPEQVLGDAVGPQADFYALGLVMAEMLTGWPVFSGSTALELCGAQISEAPVPLGRRVLGSPLGSIIQRATEKAVEQRYLHAGEMLADVEEAVATTPATALETPIVGPASDEWVSTTADKVKTPAAYAGTLAEEGLADEVEAGAASVSAAPVPPEPEPKAEPEPTPIPTGSGRDERKRLMRWTVGAFVGGILFISCAAGVGLLIHRAVSADGSQPAAPTAPRPLPTPSPGVPTPIEAPTPQAQSPTPQAQSPLRPDSSKLARLTPTLARGRLLAAGWRIVAETPMDLVQGQCTSYSVTKGPHRATVVLYHFHDPARTEIVGNSFRGSPVRRVIMARHKLLAIDAAPLSNGTPDRALQDGIIALLLR